jgi:hypothetical protein
MTSGKLVTSVSLMRGLFLLFGFLCACVAIWGIIGAWQAAPLVVGLAVVETTVFIAAYVGLQQRTWWGYRSAQIASGLLLFGFPVLTVLGVYFLSQLAKPEVKQSFSQDEADN